MFKRRLILVVPILITAIVSAFGQRMQSRNVTDTQAHSVKTTPSGDYYGLVIGNNDYQYFANLTTAINDATAVAAVLQDGYGFKTQLLLNATRDQIITALDSYQSSLHNDDNLLVYYAGHGGQKEAEGNTYWIPVDGQTNTTSHWIVAAEINGKAMAIQARHVLIISDSCYSGTMPRQRGDEPSTGPRDMLLDKQLREKSRSYITSGGNESVIDGYTSRDRSKHSVFAEALLEGLQKIKENRFSARELFDEHLYLQVGGYTKQTPQYERIADTENYSGEFIFVRANTGLPKQEDEDTVSSDTSADDLYWKGMMAYTQGRYEEAFRDFRGAADAGNVTAMTYLGYMYDSGLGTATDLKQARLWYEKGAKAGDPAAMANLGAMYDTGQGVALDRGKARQWYEEAELKLTSHGVEQLAAHGDTTAMLTLGVSYEKGDGVPRDYKLARQWYEKAALAGNARAMYDLGVLYENGLGVAQDRRQAQQWYKKAAEAGYKDAQNRLK